MKSEELYEILGEIDEQFITEAREQTAKPRAHWAKRAVAAACIVLAAGAAVVFSAALRVKSDGGRKSENSLPLFIRSAKTEKGIYDDIWNITIEYDGAYYDVLDMTDIEALDRHRLPQKITADMVGEPIAEVSSGREESFTLYQYAPYYGIVQKAVYVASYDGREKTYTFAVFCNYVHDSPRLYETAQEMFAVIGVYAAEDIAAVEIGEQRLDSPEEIARFYDLLCRAEAMGEDDFQKAVFGGLSERQQQDLSIELADSALEIRIMTKHGYCACWLTYEPKIHFIEWACNHYRLSEDIG